MQTLDPTSGKKGVLALGTKPFDDESLKYYPEKENFNALVKDFFTGYEQYFEIINMYGMHEINDYDIMNFCMSV